MDKTDYNRIEELLPRYCEGLATEEERLQVEAWMDESEDSQTDTYSLSCHRYCSYHGESRHRESIDKGEK